MVIEILCVGAAVVLAVVWWSLRTPPYRPFGSYVVPQAIVGLRPSYHSGDVIRVTATKCYRTRNLIPITGFSYYVRLSPTRLTVQNTSGAAVIDPRKYKDRCFTSTFDHVLPDLAPGVWRLEGQETSRLGSEQVTAAWYTRTFTVVSR